ncbi:MAG TPA: gamma-glutamyltransferase family protein [Burkholderiaceae bacterium]|nr:gamma-glutamyltransferase family protein [Burkholderiaceae bacterium]
MSFVWTNPYLSTRAPTFARNMVSTSQPLAAQAGLRMLARGGNAADAAIAAAAVITLTEPCSNGLGSDNFALVWDPRSGPDGELHGLNSSGIAPAAWSLDYFQRKYGGDLPAQRPVRGWDTVTVPGAVAGWVALHTRFGKLSFSDVLAPAIEYAERGFAVSPVVHAKWVAAQPVLQSQPGFAEHFLPRGRAPEIGEHFVLQGAARTLKAIAESHGAAFYVGEIGAAIARHAREHGGALTQADLAAYWEASSKPADIGAQWVRPISRDFAGHTVHQIPPNGQGIATLIALGILEHLPIADAALDSADWHHLLIEAMKLGFADTYAHVADPRGMRITHAHMLDDAYLAERAKLVDLQRAQDFHAGTPPRGGTIYLAAADASGMMVSLIQSNYMGFGSGIVVPGTGVSLHNRGHAFALDAMHPNVVRPHHRPFHTIIPGFLTRVHDGKRVPQMAFGVMGANMQPQGQVQALARMLIARQQPQAACDAPRWKWNSDVSIETEATLPREVVRELQSRGHRVVHANDSYMDFGSGQFIWRLGDPAVDGYVGASDARRDSQAVGF